MPKTTTYYARATPDGPMHVFADYGAAPKPGLTYSARCGVLLSGSDASASYFFARLCRGCFKHTDSAEVRHA